MCSRKQPSVERAAYRFVRPAVAAGVLQLLSACAGTPLQPSPYHLGRDASHPDDKSASASATDSIPAIVGAQVMPPRPGNGPTLETYSVVINNVDIRELLFAMARDAKINVDISPAVRGRVSLNAIDQTLPQILTRLARQIDIRYEFDGHNLIISPDLPFVRHYTIDYVNISRDANATTSIATQIASTGRDGVDSGGTSQLSNNSTTQISNTSNNRFWASLIGNLRSLLDDGRSRPAGGAAGGDAASSVTAPAATEGAGASGDGGDNGGANAEAAGAVAGARGAGAGARGAGAGAAGGQGRDGNGPNGGSTDVIASPETGIVSIRATQRQQEQVRIYLDKVMSSARRQVMIEATIAEVQLSEQFQQGVNWARVRADGTGWSFLQQPQGPLPLGSGATPGSGPGGLVFNTDPPNAGATFGGQNPSLGVLRYLSSNGIASIGAAVSLLQTFGKVKVLSSPKISVLNNQTAVLKVVDNKVYFTIGVQITPGTATTAPLVTYTSTPNTVPVGFVMAVTPQIEQTGSVTMNVRPTISRITGYVTDPNPALARSNVTSRIPEIQTREIESILKVNNGDVAVMGGLMQESVNDQQDGIPGAQSVPLFGNLFKYRNDSTSKSELVIFLRPIVVHDASMEGDYRSLKGQQPGPDFFSLPEGPSLPQAWLKSEEAKDRRGQGSDVPRTATGDSAGEEKSK